MSRFDILRCWKKGPITIRAAIVGAIITGIFMIVVAAFFPLSVTTQPSKSSINRPIENPPKTASTTPVKALLSIDEIESLLKREWGWESVSIKPEDIHWVRLIPEDTKGQFYVYYIANRLPVMDVFRQDNNGTWVPSLHRIALGFSEGLRPTHYITGEKRFFIIYSRAGNGSYLDIEFYAYDEHKTLQHIHTEDIGVKGKLVIRGEDMYAYGSNRRWKIEYEKGSFRKKPFFGIPRQACGAGTPVLQIRGGNSLQFKLDDKPLQFEKEIVTKNRLVYTTYNHKKPIYLMVGEELIIDDDVTGVDEIRFFYSGENVKWKNGFYASLQAISLGTGELRLWSCPVAHIIRIEVTDKMWLIIEQNSVGP